MRRAVTESANGGGAKFVSQLETALQYVGYVFGIVAIAIVVLAVTFSAGAMRKVAAQLVDSLKYRTRLCGSETACSSGSS